MNLSSDTVAILKNFSDINQNILVKPGNKLQTISTLKNILAEAEISEKFEQEFAIYDLPEFLRAVDLFDKKTLKFNGGQNLTIADDNSRQQIKYYFADKSVVVAPSKAITMPDKYVTFQLKSDMFTKLMRGVTTLNLPDIAVTGDGKEISLTAMDKKTPGSNNYKISVGETDKEFTAYFKTENFKMIPGDYDVAISSQKISHFINTNKPIQYWVAIESDSTF
tara:strand:- start:51 stop:716 length:666 start_codon:yes stop_codon:yes gene_type:complete